MEITFRQIFNDPVKVDVSFMQIFLSSETTHFLFLSLNLVSQEMLMYQILQREDILID